MKVQEELLHYSRRGMGIGVDVSVGVNTNVKVLRQSF